MKKVVNSNDTSTLKATSRSSAEPQTRNAPASLSNLTETQQMTATSSTVQSGVSSSQHQVNTTFREISLMLLKRLFGCLGNVNSIKDAYIHRRVLEFIFSKWERLAKVKDELRLKDLTQIVMPSVYFSPWLFEAIYQLPSSYQSGKLIAYKTLCHTVIRSSLAALTPLPNDFDAIDDDFIDLFYLTVHQGFISNDKVLLAFTFNFLFSLSQLSFHVFFSLTVNQLPIGKLTFDQSFF